MRITFQCEQSDNLHRFFKKEHDWGWKKFIELSKIHEGFLVDDTLTIKAQVQIIRYVELGVVFVIFYLLLKKAFSRQIQIIFRGTEK